jgi:hypothetical protein
MTRDSLQGFVEGEGFVSIEPEHYTRKTDAGENRWIKIEDYGRTLSGMRADGAGGRAEAAPGKDSRPAWNTGCICSARGARRSCRHHWPQP